MSRSKRPQSTSVLKRLRQFIMLLMAVAFAAAGYAWYWLHQPVNDITAQVYDVARGSTVSSIGHDLQRRGWMQYPQVWKWWAHFTGKSGAIKAGEYQLHPGMSPDDLLILFTSGKVILHSVKFIEGSTFAEMRNILQMQDVIEHTLQNAPDAEVMRRLHVPEVNPEGQFFPDTYQFAKGTSDLEIYAMAQRRMQRELQQAWDSRDANLSVHSPYEALILASIIEKESSLTSERPIISGVFQDRLDRGMRLQTDPTVIYGLGNAYDGNIHKADLQRDTPYNTYTRSGLPPTPICLPGATALQAATHPQRTGALYFVATGEGGAHHFSKTYEEHNQALEHLLRLQHVHHD
ncbi:MAG: endolytic transglycosylase MltG [Steroidobacter sp.]